METDFRYSGHLGCDAQPPPLPVENADAPKEFLSHEPIADTNSAAPVLSPDESRIVELIAAGYTSAEIARQFALSERAINRRTVRILGKLGVCNTLELVLYAMSRRLLGGTPVEDGG